MPQRHLVDVGLDPILDRRGLQRLGRQVAVIQLFALFATRSTARIRTLVGKIQGRIVTQLGHHMQTQWSHHVQGIVMAELAVKKAVHHLEMIANLLE
jgi:hypothetical protein